jgi:hypothetical protein
MPSEAEQLFVEASNRVSDAASHWIHNQHDYLAWHKYQQALKVSREAWQYLRGLDNDVLEEGD